MSKIAITGTIASGKTSVSIYLRSLGYDVFDCDEYNRELLQKGSKAYPKIKKAFPECFINNELDKKLLASIIFNNKERKEVLESILHPLIKKELLKKAKDTDLFFAEVPLLFETDFYKLFDYKWLVCANKETCIKRLKEKGYTRKEAIERLNNQMSIKDKKKLADRIIYNNKDFAFLNNEVDKLLTYVRK